MAASFLWFHAFKRTDASLLVDVLRNGVTVDPRYGQTTRANEEILGISPPCCYAYLGKTLKSFGQNAVALPMDALAGTVSPFDTGGLASHVGPVCTWPPERKRAYVTAYSWPSGDLPALLATYPGSAVAQAQHYLAGLRPTVPGPHGYWGASSDDLSADVWLEENGGDERSYLWEVRTADGIPGGRHILHWTCDGPMYQALLKYQEGVRDAGEADDIVSLLTRHVEGGTGALVALLRGRQVAA